MSTKVSEDKKITIALASERGVEAVEPLDLRTFTTEQIGAALANILKFNNFPVFAAINPEAARLILELYEALLIDIESRKSEAIKESADLIKYVRINVDEVVQKKIRTKVRRRYLPNFFLAVAGFSSYFMGPLALTHFLFASFAITSPYQLFSERGLRFLNDQHRKHLQLEEALQRIAIAQIETDVEAFLGLHSKVIHLRIHVLAIIKSETDLEKFFTSAVGSAVDDVIKTLFLEIESLSKRLTSADILSGIDRLNQFQESWKLKQKDLAEFLNLFNEELNQRIRVAIDELLTDRNDPYRG